jgi:hypothetical protein
MKPLDPDALLAELDFERVAGTDGEARARDVILRELRAMGLEPKVEGFELRSFEPGTATLVTGGERVRVSLRQTAGPRVAHNLVATLGSPRGEENLVYLTAHYDSVARSHGAVD